MKYYSIDRFEGDFAICIGDDEKIYKLELKKIPEKAREGDVLKKVDGILTVDEEETKKRKDELFDLQDKLFGE